MYSIYLHIYCIYRYEVTLVTVYQINFLKTSLFQIISLAHFVTYCFCMSGMYVHIFGQMKITKKLT